MRDHSIAIKYRNPINPIPHKGDKTFIYILWGNKNTGIVRDKTKNEAKGCITALKDRFPTLLSQSLFFSIGKDADDFLRQFKLPTHIHYSDKNYVYPDGIQEIYQRQMIMLDVMKEYKEVISIDWDCGVLKDVDQNMWDFLRTKESVFNGDIQTSMISYRRCFNHFRHRDFMENNHVGDPAYFHRTMPCCCFLYIRNKTLLEELMACFHAFNTTLASYSDENYLVYLIDHKYGIKSSAWMDENLHCRIVWQKKISPYLKRYDNCYFRHN